VIDLTPSDSYRFVIHANQTLASEHVRKYNAPTIDEVSNVMVGKYPRKFRFVAQK